MQAIQGQHTQDERNRNHRLRSIAVLDRCGNNWRNEKGGCGPLLHDDYCPTLPTMFQPFVIVYGGDNAKRIVHKEAK